MQHLSKENIESSSKMYNSINGERLSSSFLELAHYESDIYAHMKIAEKQRFKFIFQSHQTKSRTKLLSVLMEAVDVCHLSELILHLATYLLDTFLDFNNVIREKLELLPISCLVLAHKFEGSHSDIELKFTDLINYFNYSYTIDELKRFEMYMICTVKANFMIPTVATFANYFAEYSVTTEDYHNYLKSRTYKNGLHIPNNNFQFYLNCVLPCYCNYYDLQLSVKRLINELINMCLWHIKLINVAPSLLAAACSATARQLHNLQPIWTLELENISKYATENLLIIKEIILAYYEKKLINFIKKQFELKRNVELNKYSIYDFDDNEENNFLPIESRAKKQKMLMKN